MPSATKVILALVLFTAASALPTPQLAGEGAAADSIFSSTDNGIGYGIENAEDNLAKLISGTKTGTGNTGSTGTTGTAPPPPPARRQLDKISNGFQTLSGAAGLGSSTEFTTNALDNLDGELTSGAANLGASVGSAEVGTLEGAGNAVPRV